jgi:putative transposase
VREGRAGQALEVDRSRICTELRERLRRSSAATSTTSAWRRCSDPVFLSVRPDGPKEGVLVAWGVTEEGERVLLSVMLGMRESHQD